jgi:DNA-binding transcriptional regulator YiaG
MNFAEQLQAARAASGLSQSQAALAIGRSVRTLQAWEQAVNVPHAQIQALALIALKASKRKSRKSENVDVDTSPPLTPQDHAQR